MSTLCVFLSAIVYLLLVADTYSTAQCENATLSQSEVELILSRVNEARTKVREGKQLNGLTGSYLPPAKSMPNLTWNCTLEKDAATLLDLLCKKDNNQSVTSPMVSSTPIFQFWDPKDVLVAQALNYFLDEVDYANLTKINGLNVMYNGETVLETFANVIRHNATVIGCSKLRCSYPTPDNGTEIAYSSMCLTDQFSVTPGELIYEGVVPTTTTVSTTTTTTTTTTSATTTTTASAAVLPTGTNSKCNSNNGVTDEVRYKFLSMHNYRRILLAQGKVTRKNGNAYPKAANMARMNYDCNLEADALAYVKQCPRVKSGVANAGENYFRISTNGINSWVGGVNKAVTSWWKVVRESSSGVGVSAVAFRQNHVGTAIESWSQMAWAKTNKIGCAIGICSGEYVAVCRYTEKGNVVGQQVYTPGRLCSMCTNGCNQNGLCL